MNLVLDPIALTLVPSVAFAVAAMWHFCDLTKDHKRSFVFPGLMAILLASAATFQAAVLTSTTPFDFVAYGAFYSPVSLWSEPWRFATSIFLYDDPIVVLFTCLAVAIVGCRLAHHVRVRGVAFTFAVSSFTGTVVAAAFDPQSLVMGAAAGAFGIVTANFLVGGWKTATQLEKIARGAGIFFGVAVATRFAMTENVIGTLASAGGAVASTFVWIWHRQPSRARRSFALASTTATLLLSTLLVPPAFDLIGIAEQTRAKERETWRRLAAFEEARAKGWIADGEFAMRLETEVMAPLDEVIDDSSSWSDGRTKWIAMEHERLANAYSRLAVLKEIHAVKHTLVEAEEAVDEGFRELKLDEFWSKLPETTKQIASYAVESQIREGAEYDLSNLRRTANDLEIWHLETALASLREQVVEEGPRSPASTLPWAEIRGRWLTRRERLDRLVPDGADQLTRVQALRERLSLAIDAIE